MNYSSFDISAIRRSVVKISVADRAWLSGLFDGEGCVSHHFRKNKDAMYVRLTVNMTSLAAIDRVESIMAVAGLSVGRYESSCDNGKVLYRAVAQNAAAIVGMILVIRPYSTVKANELDCALIAMRLKSQRRQAEASEVLRTGIPPRKGVRIVA